MAGQKREARLRAKCPGHPRLCLPAKKGSRGCPAQGHECPVHFLRPNSESNHAVRRLWVAHPCIEYSTNVRILEFSSTFRNSLLRLLSKFHSPVRRKK